MKQNLDLKFTARLKEHIAQKKLYYSKHGNKAPLPAIVFASINQQKEKFTILFYDKKDLVANDIFHIFFSGDIEYIVPQSQLHGMLDGRTLDIKDGKFLVID